MLRAGDKNRTVTAVAPDAVPAPHRGSSAPFRLGLWDAGTVTSLSLLTAGVLSTGLGAYFAISSQDEADHAASLRQSLGPSGCRTTGAGPCGSLSSDVDAQSRDVALSTAFYISGGVLAAAGALVWLTWPGHGFSKKNNGTTALSLGPMLGVGRAGLRAEIELP